MSSDSTRKVCAQVYPTSSAVFDGTQSMSGIRVVSRQELSLKEASKLLHTFVKQESGKKNKVDSNIFVQPHIIKQIDSVKKYLHKSETQIINQFESNKSDQ